MTGSQDRFDDQPKCPKCGHRPCSAQRVDDDGHYAQREALVSCPGCTDSIVEYNEDPIEIGWMWVNSFVE